MIISRLPKTVFSGVLLSVVKSNKFMNSAEPPDREASDQVQIKRSKLEQPINNQSLQIMQKMMKIIQQERRQRQANEQRLERLEREQQKRRQRQEMEQQRFEKKQKFKNRAFIILSSVTFGGLALAFALSYFEYDPIERWRQNKMVKKSFQFAFDQNKYVDSPLYDQTKKYIQYQLPSNRIKLVAGFSDAGKTTVAKKILKQLQKKGEQTYYFSFGDYTLKKERLKKQFYWLIRGLKRKYQDGKQAKIIFDDINLLQPNHPQDFKFIMQDIYRLSAHPNLNITCIASKGSFLTNQIDHSFWGSLFKKAGLAFILQDFVQSGEAMRKFHTQVLKMNFKNKCKDNEKVLALERSGILQAMAELRISTGNVVSIFQKKLNYFLDEDLTKKENIEKFILFLKEKQQEQIMKLAHKIRYSRPSNLKTQTFISLLQQIKSMKKNQLKLSTCDNILYKFNNSQGKDPLFALEKLDQNDIIIFCRPRTEIEAKALEKSIIIQQQNEKKGDSKISNLLYK